jgi:hypothetical protein
VATGENSVKSTRGGSGTPRFENGRANIHLG